MVVKPLLKGEHGISHKQVSLHVEKNDKEGVGGGRGRGIEESVREKKGSHKGQDLNILTGQAKELVDAGVGSPDTNLDVINLNFDDLKEKTGGGKRKSGEIGKSKKLPEGLDLIAFVLDICPVPAK